MNRRGRTVRYEIIEDGNLIYEIEFGEKFLSLIEYDQNRENGHSFLFNVPVCPKHKDGDCCWSQWQWIAEPDPYYSDDGEDFGWWIVDGGLWKVMCNGM